MKVLVLSNLYPPFHIGGYEMSCRDSVDLLTDAGLDCRVLTSDFASYSLHATSAPPDDPRVRRTLKLHENWGTSYRVASFGDVSRANWALIASEASEFRPDIIYTWNVYGLGALRFDSLTPRMREACVHHFMDLSLFPRWSSYERSAPRNLLGALKRIVRPSAADRSRRGLARTGSHVYASEFLRRAIGRDCRPRRSIVVPSPIRVPGSMPVKTTFQLDRGNVRCVYVGQIAPHKGVDVMLEAIHRVARPDLTIRAVVYGNHVDSRFSERLMAQYGGHLTIRSGVPRERILEELHEFDIGIFPSSWQEPFGMAQLELAYAALPILTSATGGAAEFGRHGMTAMCFRHGDSESLAQSLTTLIDDYEGLAPILSAAASAEARRMCDEHTYVQRLTNFMAFVSERAGQPSSGDMSS